jgi:putative transposase
MGESVYDYRSMSEKEKKEILRTRRERDYPLHEPPHIDSGPGIFLISSACYEHKPIFDTTDLLTYLRDSVLDAFALEKFRCDAWVFMPNRHHVLVHADSLERLSEILRKLHARVATKINGWQKQRGRRVWYRSSDRKMRSEAHYWASINYIHRNPVKHAYIDDPDAWPWSSWQLYAEDNGRKALDELERKYPPLDYGKGWDD